jgi:dienelactone hydrolase
LEEHKLMHSFSQGPARRPGFKLGLGLVSVITAAAVLMGCAGNAQQQAWNSRNPARAQALAAAVPMPASESFEQLDLSWQDDARQRPVLARMYLPASTATKPASAPLVVFSHGIGGSREGYSYIGKYLAAQGIAALHVQHAGSDRNLWFGNPLGMVFRLQNAARDTEAIDRAHDLSFALTQVLQDAKLAPRLDAQRIAAAGHSYGANTTLLLAGARVQRAGRNIDLRDTRVKAAVVISAPPFYGETDPKAILGGIDLPTLHITATGDEIVIPGYYSAAQDRVRVYEATGTPEAKKLLAVFKDGSHSMFTDRLGTGGNELNPRVKTASRELMLAFLNQVFAGRSEALQNWPGRYHELVARFDSR